MKMLESGVMPCIGKKFAWMQRNKMTSNYSYKKAFAAAEALLKKTRSHMSYFDATINHLKKASK
jgi:hypothetical protein